LEISASSTTRPQKCPGLRADGTPYTSIIRRRCRCLDCAQVRIDKEYT